MHGAIGGFEGAMGQTMGYSHLTFDCYGTLIDWRRGVEGNLGGLLRRRGLPEGRGIFPLYVRLEVQEESGYKPYREVLLDTAKKVGEQLGLHVPLKEAEAFAASVPSWPPFDDTVDVLRELGRNGYKRVILSNVDRDLLEATVKTNNLEVDGFITAQDVKSYKPSPRHWIHFLATPGVEKQRVLHVAQSVYHDIVPADGLGLATAWINRYGEPPPADQRATYTFLDLRGLLKMLQG